MPSDRFAQALKLAAELGTEERAELADQLWSTVPDELSDEWKQELRDRVAGMEQAEANGEQAGIVLSFDEMVERVKASIDDE
jgi:Putative addiction module component